MFIYQRLKDCREDKDLTQTQIGQLLGIDQRVYSTYETGKRQIPVNYLIELALFYGTSVDYLVGLTNNPAPYEHRRKAGSSVKAAGIRYHLGSVAMSINGVFVDVSPILRYSIAMILANSAAIDGSKVALSPIFTGQLDVVPL